MDDDKPRLPPKRDVALALLEGSSLYVHLDPRREQVLVPKHFLDQPQLVLQVGLNMAVKIPDLEVDDDGITCTLSFNRTPFWCRLPWTAVFALVGEDGRGMVWPDDVPGELAAQAKRPSLKVVSSKKKAKPKEDEMQDEDQPRARPTLSAVPPPPDAEAGSDTESDEPATVEETADALEASLEATDAPPGDTDGETSDDDDPDDDPNGKKKLPPYLRVVK